MMPPDFSGLARLAYVGFVAICLAIPAALIGFVALLVWILHHVRVA